MSCEGHGIESRRAFEQAQRDGNKIVLPEPDQLLIDIDSDRAEGNIPPSVQEVPRVR